MHKGGRPRSGSTAVRAAGRGVQHLLLRFGVASQLRHRTALYNGRGFPSWQIEVSHAESIRRFAADIGMLGKEDAVGAPSSRSSGGVATRISTPSRRRSGARSQGQGRSHVAVRLGGRGEAGQLQLARRHTLTAAGNARTACRGARLPRPRLLAKSDICGTRSSRSSTSVTSRCTTSPSPRPQLRRRRHVRAQHVVRPGRGRQRRRLGAAPGHVLLHGDGQPRAHQAPARGGGSPRPSASGPATSPSRTGPV